MVVCFRTACLLNDGKKMKDKTFGRETTTAFILHSLPGRQANYTTVNTPDVFYHRLLDHYTHTHTHTHTHIRGSF